MGLSRKQGHHRFSDLDNGPELPRGVCESSCLPKTVPGQGSPRICPSRPSSLCTPGALPALHTCRLRNPSRKPAHGLAARLPERQGDGGTEQGSEGAYSWEERGWRQTPEHRLPLRAIRWPRKVSDVVPC